MTTPNRIVLKSKGWYEEAPALAALSPGHLLMKDSTGKIKKHNAAGGRAERLWAIEDALQGKTITDAYAADDIVRHQVAFPGDLMLSRVPAAAAAIVFGDALISNGDGTLIKSPGSAGSALYTNTAASANITNTTAETAFDKSYTVPANTLQVGDVLKIRAQVTVPTTNSTDTLNLKLKIGTTVIVATGAVDVANSDEGWIEATVVVRSIGATGTFVAAGTDTLGVPGTATVKGFNLGSTTIDTTAAQAITVTATWSVANAGNVARLDLLTVELSRDNNVMATADEALDNSAGTSEAFLRARVL
jgi:hypothetical protein